MPLQKILQWVRFPILDQGWRIRVVCRFRGPSRPGRPADIEVVLSYALFPSQRRNSKAKYLATHWRTSKERETAEEGNRRVHSASFPDLPG